jgi:hypothetical protein
VIIENEIEEAIDINIAMIKKENHDSRLSLGPIPKLGWAKRLHHRGGHWDWCGLG